MKDDVDVSSISTTLFLNMIIAANEYGQKVRLTNEDNKRKQLKYRQVAT